MSKNLRELRERRRLSLAELYARLDRLGRPIVPTGLHKIEKGTRRVDVDDLVALAMALNVTPTRLLLPGAADADSAPVELSPTRAVSWTSAWSWATGQAALPPADQPSDADVSPQVDYEFSEESRPFDPPPELLLSEVEALEEQVGALVREWIQAVRAGHSPERLALLLRAESLLNRLPTGGEITITYDTPGSHRG